MIFCKTLLISSVNVGSLKHIVPICISIVFIILLIQFSKRRHNKKHKERVLKTLGFLVSLLVLAFHINLILKGNYNLVTDLPLFPCSFMALFVFILHLQESIGYSKFYCFGLLQELVKR